MTLVAEDHDELNLGGLKREAGRLFTLPSLLIGVLLMQLLAWFTVPAWSSQPSAWILLGLSLPLVGWLAIHRAVVQKVLTTKKRQPQPLLDPRWSPFRYQGWGADTLTSFLLEAEGESDDLVLVLHGMNSTIQRFESRALHLSEMGLHVVGLNMRGQGGCELRSEWTPLKVAEDLEAMLDQLPEHLSGPLPKRVWFYGHSMGGFLALWLSTNGNGWWRSRLHGIMLESPVTSIPLAIEGLMPRWMRPFSTWVRHVLRREYLRIHPNLDLRYSTAQVPHFGMPDVPVLVLQSGQDEQLGQIHFKLYERNCDSKSELHLLKHQPHTTGVDSEQRRSILESWLTPRCGNLSGGLL